MNILMFLLPKSQVSLLTSNQTVRQAIEKMEFHRFSSLPIIDENGKYFGVLSEGDLLYFIKNSNILDIRMLEGVKISEISRIRDNVPVKADQSMNDLLEHSINQNFVPVVDDQNNFIGIITRKSIINYFINNK